MTPPTGRPGRSRTPTASSRGKGSSSSRPWSPPSKPGNTPDHGASKPLIRCTGTKTLKPSPAAAVPRSTRSSDDIPSPRTRARPGNQGRLRVGLGGACGGRLRSAGHPPDPLRESQGKLHGTVAVRARQCAGTAGPRPARGNPRPGRGGETPTGLLNPPPLPPPPANHPGKDRHPRRVRRGPAERAQRVRAEGEDGARPGGPTGPTACEVEELVEHAGIAVDDQRVAIAATLNQGVGAQWVGTGIALARVLKGHRHGRVHVVDDVVGEPVRRP